MNVKIFLYDFSMDKFKYTKGGGMMKRYVLDEMIWTEVEEVKTKIKMVVIPTGSCEQHGPNSTFATDTVRAYEFCKLLDERMGDKILICPPVTYGLSGHHMAFPGTITIGPETLVHIYMDIVLSLHKHGFQKFIFVNGHGGNRTALTMAITELYETYGISAYWTGMGSPFVKDMFEKAIESNHGLYGHGCEIETSQVMYLAPWAARENRKKGEVLDSIYSRRIFKDGGCPVNWRTDASANGALVDARKASAEFGERMTEKILDEVESLINQLIESDSEYTSCMD